MVPVIMFLSISYWNIKSHKHFGLYTMLYKQLGKQPCIFPAMKIPKDFPSFPSSIYKGLDPHK